MNRAVIAALIQRLKVSDKETSRLLPWVLWPEQVVILDAFCRYDRILILKGRQIGSSTFNAFLVLLYCVSTPGAKAAIVADTESLAMVLLARAAEFGEQLGIVKRANQANLRLRNGSEIVALSAGADLRGRTFQCLMMTELDSWPEPEALPTLLQTTPAGAKIITESTGKGPDRLMHELWSNEASIDHKMFFSVEDRVTHRSNRPLTEAETARAAELGYTMPEAAAWFFDKVNADFRGEEADALREYPQLPEHAFYIREGRWIVKLPDVLPSSDWNGFQIFSQPNQKHRYIVSLDPAKGNGGCDVAIVVIDLVDGRIAATLADPNLLIDDAIAKVQQIYVHYLADDITIEANGIGAHAIRAALARNLPVIPIITDTSSRYGGLLAVKRAVENGTLAAGDDFRRECESISFYDSGRRKDFTGRKDLLMATAIVYERVLLNPYVVPTPADERTLVLDKYLKPQKVWY